MRPVFDPTLVPVIAVDRHLPPVAPERLLAQALRERFAAPPTWQPEVLSDRRLADRPPTAASVLIPLVRREPLCVLLTRRTADLTDHPGQISFPGGRAEPEDRGPVETALREAEEEIGLDRSRVEVLGVLPRYRTATGFVVDPVVALVESDLALAPDAREVAEVFEVPLPFLMTPAHHHRHAVEFDGVRREFFSMPWDATRGAVAAEGAASHFIWGATASMLRNLYRFLSA
ncbi:MAG: CoA pyrophosphatase [Ideonella sp.]|jgi:8-oxo-dGTP pyrophosphatase MutT (NUDIX family)|nr:CoA pyrophosphatase [Ideonella sp.]